LRANTRQNAFFAYIAPAAFTARLMAYGSRKHGVSAKSTNSRHPALCDAAVNSNPYHALIAPPVSDALA
jgi:hypothetical protein